MNDSSPYILNSFAAAASFALGILGLLGGLALTGIPAVGLGHWALLQIRKQAPMLAGKGYAVTGLITGYTALLLTILLWPSLRGLFDLLFDLIETHQIIHGR